jgi:hypothetical protein
MKLLGIILDLISSLLNPKQKPVAVESMSQPETGLEVLHLKRISKGPDGIFSELSNSNGVLICYTAEHAYQDNLPKLPDGTWTVQLGVHQLDHGGPQKLYCVQNVPNHSGICFHIGNTPQVDSDGCLLLGASITTVNGVKMVVNSAHELAVFMLRMDGVAAFTLVVS